MIELTDNAEIRKRDVYVVRVLPSGDIMFLHLA